MSGFPQATCQFLADLQNDNTRSWFDANRDRYENDRLLPAQTIIDAMAPALSQLSPPHVALPKVNGSIRRLHRDIRFSKDRSPFDPRLHMVFWTGDHPNRSPAIHIVLHPDHAAFGAGQFAFGKPELERYRHAISHDAEKSADLLSVLSRPEACGCALTRETLKKRAPGADVAARHETLLERKGLVAKTLGPGHPMDRVCDSAFMRQFLAGAARLYDWLRDGIGGGESGTTLRRDPWARRSATALSGKPPLVNVLHPSRWAVRRCQPRGRLRLDRPRPGARRSRRGPRPGPTARAALTGGPAS